jgi:hypothetical protein
MKMGGARARFFLRALVILMVCVCALALAVADMVSRSYGAAPLAEGHRVWMAAQGGLGLFFAFFATLHVVYATA